LGGSFCGDGTCDTAENSNNCPGDCGPVIAMCGNGVCETLDEVDNCPEDCDEL
jgi:hypothetical protein